MRPFATPSPISFITAVMYHFLEKHFLVISLPLVFLSFLLLQPISAQTEPLQAATNETGLLSGIWSSLTTVGKTSSCPGECLHAITSLLCDQVLEEIQCGEPYLRCCVSQQVSYDSHLVTVPPTEASVDFSTEAFSVISNNHNLNQTSTPETIPEITTASTFLPQVVTMTTAAPSMVQHYMAAQVASESAPEPSGHPSTGCPVACSKASLNTFCVKPVLTAQCGSPEEECCLETESAIDTLTKNMIKLVQQSVALNETKNIGSELTKNIEFEPNSPSTVAPLTTQTALPMCEGTCVVSLFKFLCDAIDTNQFCTNGGSCCVNIEPTTPPPPAIGPCEGKCIPVILSGMCIKPFELVLKTSDCASSTICCADRKTEPSGEETINDENAAPDIETEPEKNLYYRPQIGRPLHAHPPAPPMPPHLPPSQYNVPYNPNAGPYLAQPHSNVMPPMPPMHPMYPKPSYALRPKPPSQAPLEAVFSGSPSQSQMHFPTEQVNKNNKPYMRPHSSSGNFEDKLGEEMEAQLSPAHSKPLSQEYFPCPGSCMNPMLKFTCFGSKSITSFYCPNGQACCAPKSEIEKFETFILSAAKHPVPTANSNVNQPMLMPSTSEPPQPEVVIPTTSELPPTPHVCGVKGNRSKRVVGGQDSYPGEWCWQVALVNQQNKYICGGALIGRSWVLTAAHCITNLLRKSESIYVRAGEFDLTRSSKIGQKVATSFVHHNHNGQSLDNDIALLKLQSPIVLNAETCLVCLPTRSTKRDPGKWCTVTGYGFEHESGPIAMRIRQASVPIVDDQECSERINSVSERQFLLPVSSFCAGGEGGNDACQGDGGSGLACQSDGFYELTGLVSWGFGCGRHQVPGVYVKVSSFVGWINQIVSTNSN